MEHLEELLTIGWAAAQHRGEARWKGDLVDEYVQIGQGVSLLWLLLQIGNDTGSKRTRP